MEWFKFYGKDWLTDVKLMSMGSVDRLCFLTLLCLASNDDGWVRGVDEWTVIELTHLDNGVYDTINEKSRAQGVIERLQSKGIVQITPSMQDTKTIDLYVVAWEKRQAAMPNAERQRRWREKQPLRAVTTNNETLITRVDKNRKELSAYNAPLQLVKDNLKEQKKPRIDSHVLEVFSLFGKYPKVWEANKTQRGAAERLYQEHGIPQVKKALEFYRENGTEPFCPVVNDPWKLDNKWADLHEFRQRNNL